jgi:hypothetical protein
MYLDFADLMEVFRMVCCIRGTEREDRDGLSFRSEGIRSDCFAEGYS